MTMLTIFTNEFRPSGRMLAAALLCACVLTISAPAAANAFKLDHWVRVMAVNPADGVLANEFRRACRNAKRVADCIEPLQKLLKQFSDSPGLRYNAALIYVDAMAGKSILAQGQLSTRSIDRVVPLIKQDANDWLAYYIRGLNNLYWPTFFRRTARAIDDLRYCVTLVTGGAVAQEGYHVRAWIALGDALAKADAVHDAVAAWTAGIKRFPKSRALKERLNVPYENIRLFVAQQRDIDRPIDTDLKFLTDSPEVGHDS